MSCVSLSRAKSAVSARSPTVETKLDETNQMTICSDENNKERYNDDVYNDNPIQSCSGSVQGPEDEGLLHSAQKNPKRRGIEPEMNVDKSIKLIVESPLLYGHLT